MNELLSQCEQSYRELLTRPEFQLSYATWINTLIQVSPPKSITCPRELIYQKDQLSLYYYKASHKKKMRTSILIVYALVNKPNILDLHSDRSFIQKLLDNGLDVFLVNFGNPTQEDENNTLEKYINVYMAEVVKKIQRVTKQKTINLLGICQGGVLSLCYSALFPKQINALITMVTPVDFHQDSVLSGLLKHIDTEKLVNKSGNIPGLWISMGLQSLKPFRIAQTLQTTTDLEFFIRMERWINDCPDHPARFFHEFINCFYQKNLLIKGQLKIGKKYVDLSKLKMPILNIYAANDHLVPIPSSSALKEYVGSRHYQEIIHPGGHIGTFVSEEALNRIPYAIAKFLIQ